MPQFTVTAVCIGDDVDEEPTETRPENFAMATMDLAEELNHFPRVFAEAVFQEWLRQALYQAHNRGTPEDSLNRSEVQVTKSDENWTYTFRYDGRV